jgi:hypothetical protein
VRLSKKDSHLFLQQSEFLEKYATAALERPACRIRRYSYSKLEDLDALAPFYLYAIDIPIQEWHATWRKKQEAIA